MADERPSLKSVMGSAGAIVVLLSAITLHEDGAKGPRTKPYIDLPGGKWTVCSGQTNVPMRTYTIPECNSMLAKTVETTAVQVAATVPGFETLTTGQKVAAIDLAYNVGLRTWAYASYRDSNGILQSRPSTVRQMYIERKFPEACQQFTLYRMALGKDCSIKSNGCYGVWLRRVDEVKSCLSQ